MIEVPGYKIQHELGKGGMATVYLAVQESLNRPVALKILDKFDTQAQVERFFNEGKIIASLDHRNIITIHDLGEVNGRCYLAMEYLEGGDLNQYIDNKKLQADEATRLIKLIANCLAFVHDKGILHRDIKPENILFRKDGTLVLTDFGVAKQIQTDSSLTMDGITVGSPFYISPEQAEQKSLDARTDIYSLGIIFYEMLTGHKPFQGDSQLQIIIAHLTTEAAPLPKHLKRYQELLDLMIAKDVADRFESATDVVDYLDKATKPLLSYEVTKKLGNVLSTKSKSIKSSIVMPLPIKKCITAIKSQGKWIGLGIAFAFIAAVSLYYFSVQTKQTPLQPTANNETKHATEFTETSESVRASKTSTHTGRLSDRAVQRLLTKAQLILEDQNLTLSKLQQAYDVFHSALNKDPDNVDALQGIDQIAVLELNIKNSISAKLAAAEKSLLEFRLTSPENDNAMYYYQQILRLDARNSDANQGQFRVADAYADLAEWKLDDFDYTKAKVYINKGLVINPDSTRLLALQKKTNMFIDAPERAFKKILSIFD